MEQWEYRELFIEGDQWAIVDGKRELLPRMSIESVGRNLGSVTSFLNAFGEDGWELVAVMPLPQTYQRLIFKRRLKEKSEHRELVFA